MGGAADPWTTSPDWSPPDLTNANFIVEVRNNDPGANCTDGSTTSLDQVQVRVTYRTIIAGTVNPPLTTSVCNAADFNFVIDLSGSVDAGELSSMQTAIKDFVDAFDAQGSGLYSGTTFMGNTTTDGLPEGAGQAGYVSGATFKGAGYINDIGPTGGFTPAADGIQDAMANIANDRAGVPNIMFIVTDGSPNVRLNDATSPDTSDPVVWFNGANDSIGQANAARAAGYVVFGLYLGAGDTSLPFTNAGDSEWSETVMKHYDGAGVLRQIAFSGLANELEAAVGCAQFVASEVHDPSHTDVTNQTLASGTMIHDKAIVNGSPIAATGTVDFRRFDDSSCETQVGVEAGVALAGGTAESTPFAPASGPHAFMVHYNGDGNYAPEDGPCERYTISETAVTPTPFVTPTPIPSDTPSPTPSPTPTPTDTPSPTPSPTPTPTDTPVPTTPVPTTPAPTTPAPTTPAPTTPAPTTPAPTTPAPTTPAPTTPAPTTPAATTPAPTTPAPPTPSPTPTPTAPNITGGVTSTPYPSPTGPIGGVVDVVTGGSGGGNGSNASILLAVLALFVVTAAGSTVFAYKRASTK